MAKLAPPAFVYRICRADEWAELQSTGAPLGATSTTPPTASISVT